MSLPETSQLADQAWALADAGRLREAEALFGQLCQLAPEDAEAWMMRGAIQVELGDRVGAGRCLRQALELDAGYADPHLHLGKLALAASDAEEAQRCAEKALALDPDYVEAWLLLGSVHAANRNHQAAIECAGKALEREPGNVQATLLLSMASAQAGQLVAAEVGYRRILESQPGRADAWRALGDLLMVARRHDEAVQAYQSLLKMQPADPGLCNNLGNAYFAQGDMVNAEAWFRKALALPGVLPETHANLGMVLQSRGELDEAVACYQKALTAQPDNPDFHLQIALGLQSLGRYEEAIAHCDTVLRADPGSANAIAGKASILQKMGEYRQSRDLLLPLIDSGCANGNATLVFAEAEAKVGDADRAIELLEGLLEKNGSTLESQRAHAALGELLDKCGRYDQAFHHFTESNRLKQGRFDPRKHDAYVGRLISTYTPELLATRSRDVISSTELPVFIVGMPRSGTSLVEQILASHPAVHGAGELEDILKITHVLSTRYRPVSYPECMALAGFDVLKEHAERHLDKLRTLNPDSLRVTDKMPHNFLHLGLIQLLFPRSRVIHISRDPLDTCLSCYFQEFSASHSYANDLSQLGEYYRQYERLMEHWKHVLNLPMLHIRYEDLVEDQEGISRRMVDFCGLNWDERVLHFHETRRNVATPSFDQVRQPMYRKSLQRWRNYESHLGPLIAALK